MGLTERLLLADLLLENNRIDKELYLKIMNGDEQDNIDSEIISQYELLKYRTDARKNDKTVYIDRKDFTIILDKIQELLTNKYGE